MTAYDIEFIIIYAVLVLLFVISLKKRPAPNLGGGFL